MRDWRSVLKADPTEWLLENDNPSVRYFTLFRAFQSGFCHRYLHTDYYEDTPKT